MNFPQMYLSRQNHHRYCLRKPKAMLGFTLIEVLISVLILVFGIGGASLLYLRSLTASQGEGSKAIANQLAQDIYNRILANPDFAPPTGKGKYWQYLKGATSIGTQATQDIQAWNNKAQTLLPGGTSLVTVTICRSNKPDEGKPNADKCDTDQTASTNPIVVKIWWAEKISTLTTGEANVRTTAIDPSSSSAPDRPNLFMVVGL